MHQIQVPLGLRPRPCWGSLERSLNPLAGFKGHTSNGWEGKGWGIGRDRRQRKREMEGREARRGERRKGPPKGWFTPHVRNPEKYHGPFFWPTLHINATVA